MKYFIFIGTSISDDKLKGAYHFEIKMEETVQDRIIHLLSFSEKVEYLVDNKPIELDTNYTASVGLLNVLKLIQRKYPFLLVDLNLVIYSNSNGYLTRMMSANNKKYLAKYEYRSISGKSSIKTEIWKEIHETSKLFNLVICKDITPVLTQHDKSMKSITLLMDSNAKKYLKNLKH